jgi:hypothetical protein
VIQVVFEDCGVLMIDQASGDIVSQFSVPLPNRSTVSSDNSGILFPFVCSSQGSKIAAPCLVRDETFQWKASLFIQDRTALGPFANPSKSQLISFDHVAKAHAAKPGYLAVVGTNSPADARAKETVVQFVSMVDLIVK